MGRRVYRVAGPVACNHERYESPARSRFGTTCARPPNLHQNSGLSEGGRVSIAARVPATEPIWCNVRDSPAAALSF